jgi:hypothetical protein
MSVSERIRELANHIPIADEQAYVALVDIAKELEGCLIVKPYTTELQNGKLKQLWVRDAGAIATTWDEAFTHMQEFYDDESDKASGGVYYVRAGLTQGKPLKEE